MATNDEFNAAQEQMAAQIDALEAQKDALRANHNPPTLLPREFQTQYNNRYHTQVAGIQSQINAIQRQSRMMEGQLRRGVAEQNQTARNATAQQKYQDAQRKANEASRKTALKETQDKLAGILGTKPKDLTDTLQDAVYDPRTHKVLVPKDEKASKEAIQSAKLRGKALNVELQKYAPNNQETGRKTTINADSFFGEDALPYTVEKGNRVYTTPSGEVYATIPDADAARFQEKFDKSIAPREDISRVVSPDVFNQARAQIGMLGGDVPDDIVGTTQAREERARLAAPAINPAAGFAPGLLPNQRVIPANGPLPSTVGTIAPALVDNSDLLQPNITQRLKDGTVATVGFQPNVLGNTEFAPPPAWQGTDTRLDVFKPGYRTQNQMARAAVNQAVLGGGGAFSRDDVLAASDYADKLGLQPGDPRRGDVTKGFLERRAQENERPADDYKMMATPVDAVARLGSAGLNVNPFTAAPRAVGAAIPNLLDPNALSLIPDKSAQRAELEKRFVQEQNNGVIGPDTNMEQYVNFFMNGPQPTNPVQLVP